MVDEQSNRHLSKWNRAGRALCLVASFLFAIQLATEVTANNGTLELTAIDQATEQPTPARLELYRGESRLPGNRKTVSAGVGAVIPETLALTLPPGAYRFRLTRGPEYKSLTGNFTLERTSQDSRTIELPRMLDMLSEGWVSCDMAVPAAVTDLKVRMVAEDLHAAVPVKQLGAAQFPQLLAESIKQYQPLWIEGPAQASPSGDLLAYGTPTVTPESERAGDSAPASDPVWFGEASTIDSAHIAIANPFAWHVPLWLASESVDGLFVLGWWLREDRQVLRLPKGNRPLTDIAFKGPLGPGRYAESIYWQALEAGLKLVPLAGTGTISDQPSGATTGYNRVYSTSLIEEPILYEDEPAEEASSKISLPVDSQEMFANVWSGRVVVTNGPMLRPSLGGYHPGHTFTASAGEKLRLEMALKLTVRDEVDYLEVIQNGRVFYSARLEEYKEAGGHLPPLEFTDSGWALVRVVTRHADHFRFASSAPWYVEFDQQPRISRKAVGFFQQWLSDCEQELKQRPREQLTLFIPTVQKARTFWSDQLSQANAD